MQRTSRVEIVTTAPSNGHEMTKVTDSSTEHSLEKGIFVRDGSNMYRLNGATRRDPHEARMGSAFQHNQFTIVLVLFQLAFFVLFGLFAKYDASAMPGAADDDSYTNFKYPLFQDTHVMIFIGFGFLMTFLKRYGFSAVSLNMMLACFTIQWGMIFRGFLSHEFEHHGKFTISLEECLTADFAAAVVLISMGAMLGKLSPVQYLLMAFIETPVAIFVEHHVVHTLHVNDVGGSIIVHAFGAYFGMACARAFAKKEQRGHEHEGSTYHTDIFAMIGAIFLWCFWPSFNSAVAEPADARQRAMINTVLSLVACTMATFITSGAVDKHKRFNMVHMANSTLAGGVAIGTAANVCLNPLHAMIVGAVAGVISVLGYQYITPFLANKFGIHDTCGVHNLHGMPAVIAAFASAIFAVTYDPAAYGKTLNDIYPGMVSATNTAGFDATSQALRQLAGLGLVLIAAVVSGFLTGFLLKLKVWNQVRDKEYYADGDYWETPEDYDFTTRILSKIDHIEINEHTALKAFDDEHKA